MNKIASVKTINGKATVTVDTEQSHEVINVENGACLVLVKGEDSDNPQPTPTPSRKATFAQTLTEMNEILASRGFKKITDTGTEKTYNYLLTAWNKADAEWNDDKSWLFDAKSYPDIVPWHGVVKSFEDEAYNSLHAWLMAMQLAELAPTTGTTTNTQTEFFQLAYSYGGGRAVPIYTLDIHADPMVSRLAAGACYVMLRSAYNYADMDKMREEFGGLVINASDWNGLGYVQGSDGKMQKCGYLVNSEVIIPAAPGPFANGCDNGRVKPWEQGQPIEQFDLCDGNYDWDFDQDEFVCTDYNMGAQTPIEEWNSYSKEHKGEIINAAACSRCTDHYLFGKKNVHFDGAKMGSRYGKYPEYLYYWFSETNDKPTATNDVWEVGGPFADIESIFFANSNVKGFFNTALDIADNSRFPTFHNQYGRQRPCSGPEIPSARSPIDGAKVNGLYNVDLSCIFADTEEQRNKWSQVGGFVVQTPKSYPSGHSTQAWTAALLLGQMKPETLQKYSKKAYELSIARSIGRAHWNSDLIYGRLFGTMILPILNAMRGLRDGYEKTKAAVNGEQPEPDYKGEVQATVTIRNQSGKTVKHDGKICFVVYGTDPRNTGYKGYFRFRAKCNSTDLTIGNGQARTYNVTFVADDDPKVGLGMHFASQAQRSKYQSNNAYYIDNAGMTCLDFPTTDTFREGGMYTMVIPADTHEWTGKG